MAFRGAADCLFPSLSPAISLGKAEPRVQSTSNLLIHRPLDRALHLWPAQREQLGLTMLLHPAHHRLIAKIGVAAQQQLVLGRQSNQEPP
jgi:hypothetical protein